jgi:hypothetical protein
MGAGRIIAKSGRRRSDGAVRDQSRECAREKRLGKSGFTPDAVSAIARERIDAVRRDE